MKVGERTWCHRSLTPVSVRCVTHAASEPLEPGQMVMLLAPRRGSSPPFISGPSNLSAPLTTVSSISFFLVCISPNNNPSRSRLHFHLHSRHDVFMYWCSGVKWKATRRYLRFSSWLRSSLGSIHGGEAARPHWTGHGTHQKGSNS